MAFSNGHLKWPFFRQISRRRDKDRGHNIVTRWRQAPPRRSSRTIVSNRVTFELHSTVSSLFVGRLVRSRLLIGWNHHHCGIIITTNSYESDFESDTSSSNNNNGSGGRTNSASRSPVVRAKASAKPSSSVANKGGISSRAAAGGARGDRNENWKTRFKQLKAYHAEHGNSAVPCEYKLNPGLARWVCWQRQRRASMIENRRWDRI